MSDIIIDDSNLKAGLSAFEVKALKALQMYSETAAMVFQNYARENRPWTDRTGQARQRLSGYSEEIQNGYRINIAHGVDYGIWLEYAHEMKYAILEPTVRLKGPEVINGMNNLLEKVGIV